MLQIAIQLQLPYRTMLRIFGLSCAVLVSACASIKPASEADDPTTYTYTHPADSGLIAGEPYPNPDAVCVSLNSSSLTKPFELENHFLIACPKHEKGAIENRKINDTAQVVGNAKHWVVLRVSGAPAT